MFRHILTNPHIGVPFLTIFVFNFNWQFVETALAPAGADILQWVSSDEQYSTRAELFCLRPVLIFFNIAK